MLDFDEFEFDCPPDVFRMKLLSDITFGDGYISQIELIHYLENPQKYIVTTICHKGNVIGFSIQEIIDEQLTGVDERLKKHLLNIRQNTGWINRKHTLLAKAYRGIGLGTKLIEVSEQKLEKLALPTFSLVWDYKENGIKERLKPFGYTEITTINDYWHKKSLEQKFQCAICGDTCRCRAIVMVKLP